MRGVVQGVGFRPFIYRIAVERGLAGWVANDSEGVEIEAQGEAGALEEFVADIRRRQPPLARVEEVEVAPIEPTDESAAGRFLIRESVRRSGREALVPADAAVCRDCLDEMSAPDDRRHDYPFINCTNCGPRYTIIEGIPYDRARTTMRKFTMCERCRREYEDPRDRRFHAEPNACPVCGPAVEFRASEEDRQSSGGQGAHAAGDPIRNEVERPRGPAGDFQTLQGNDAVVECVRRLKEGYIVAIKGIGGFHLAVDATNEEAVRRLRQRKHRELKPLAIMCGSLAAAAQIAVVSEAEAEFLAQSEAPIVLLRKRERARAASECEGESGAKRPAASIPAPSVAPRSRYYGVMLPYAPLHHLLFRYGAPPLVMTSGNVTDEPICKDNDEAVERLGSIADFFLLHNRDIRIRCDDSVGWVLRNEARILRRSRGYTPIPITMPEPSPPILAVGPELKNTVCLAHGKKTFLSQHIGDLKDARTYRYFLETVEHLEKLLEIEPEIVACDLHPLYLTTKFAREQPLRLVQVQHHHAHIVACMAENQYWEPVIGVAFDGTGYGLDGTVWGGEFLMVDRDRFRRVLHLEAVPLPGGDRAVEEPWRTALAYLWRAFDGHPPDLPAFGTIERSKIESVAEMLRANVNSPLCSSVGRAFDAVSAMAGVCLESRYEGQPAIELEGILRSESTERYDFEIRSETVSLAECVRQVVRDIRRGEQPETISVRFHNTIVAIITESTARIADREGIRTVALSGGVFQNGYLVERVVPELERRGLRVLLHRLVPPNDGGVALGQSVIALWGSRCA